MHRTLCALVAATALLAPTAFLASAGAQTVAPDLAVTQLVVGRLLFPPTKFTITTEVCNLGTDTAPAGAILTWTATPKPGPLNQGSGATRVIGTTSTAVDMLPNTCQVFKTFWGGYPPADPDMGGENVGEFTFTAGVTVANDSDSSNNIMSTDAAHPFFLDGTDVGGLDLP